jgi:hypothetical protein
MHIISVLFDFVGAVVTICAVEALTTAKTYEEKALIRVFRRAAKKLGGRAAAAEWLDTPILEGKSARQLVKDRRHSEVFDYIKRSNVVIRSDRL